MNMGEIKVVGLGPGSYDCLTVGALNEMENAERLYLRTRNHPSVSYLDRKGIKYETFDGIYDTLPTFGEVYQKIAATVIESARVCDTVYAVPGNPLVAEDSVRMILSIAGGKGIGVRILPAVSFIDAMINSLSIDPIDGLKVLDGLQLDRQRIDTGAHNIITQVYNRRVASDVKLHLMKYYRDDAEVVLVRAAGVEGLERIERMPLYEIDRSETIDHLTSLYIPPSARSKYDFEDLVGVMKKLRGEGGCPWDRKQTHGSLKQYLLEECYEVMEAIDQGSPEKLVEELGDVLLQVVFHAELSSENDQFDILDVTDGITSKMIERHPHIFGGAHLENSADVLDSWEEIKRKEQDINTVADSLKHVPSQMPALMRSYKVQQKAAGSGFGMGSTEGLINKINQESKALIDVYKSEKYGKIIKELGNLLFSVVSVYSSIDIMPEFALNECTDRFIATIEHIESRALSSGKKLGELTSSERNELWEEAKVNNI